MGEDVDDFVVRTKSKTDQIIRDYTAVASNAYKGVSVLDPNGNLRDTYSILLDIAEIYKEIQAEDQKAGTNRAQALVEQLAGKNRSNIAASILQNPELLRQSYEAAQNSQGVGQKELDVYLDSVEAKLKKLQNRLQELAAVTIDSEWLKALVDFGTQAIQVFTKLSETFGGLNVIIGSVMGIMMQKSGKGIFNYDKITKSWSFGLKNIFSGIKDNINKEVFSGVEGAFKDVSKSSSITDAITTVVNTGQDVIPAGFKEFYNSLEDKTISLGNAMAMYKEQVNGATSAMGVFKNIGMNALSTVGNILLSTIASMAVSAAINLVIKGFDEILHHSEKVIEAGKKAGTKIDEIQDGIKEKLDFDDNSKERYIELRSGVNIDTGKNISLTNEEYEEYISLSNQIADMYPSLVSSFDESGNAVLKLSKNADQATESLSKLIEQDRIIAGNEIKDQLGDRVKGAMEEVDTYRDQISDLEEEVGGYVTVGSVLSGQSDAVNLLKGVTFDVNSDAAKAFENAILSSNAKFYDDFVQRFEVDGLGGGTVTYYLSTEGIENIQDESYLQELNDVLKEYGFTESEDYYRKQNEKNAKIGSVEGQINEVWRGVAEDIIASFQADPIYNNLSEELKSSISQMMYGLDYEEIFKDMPDQDLSNIGEIFADKYLTPIVSAISDNGVIDEEKVKIFDKLLSLDTSDMKNSELRDSYNDLVEQLSDDEEIQKNILVTLNIGYRDENGEFHYNATKRRNELFEAIGGTVAYDEKGYATTHSNFSGNFIGFDKFSTLDQSDFDAMEYMRDSMGVPLEDIKSWDDLIAKIQEAKEEMTSTPEVEKTDTLNDLFNNENYSSAAEGYEKKLSSLTGALENIRSEGKLTAEQMTALQEEFPDMTDFSEEAIGEAAFKQLNGWITLIRENMDGMTPEGIKQTETYIHNLTMSMGELGISAEKAKLLIHDQMVTASRSGDDGEKRIKQEKNYMDFISQVGEEDIGAAVSFVADTSNLEGDINDIILRWQGYVVDWELEIETQKAIQELESVRDFNQSKLSYNEAIGRRNTAEDYARDNEVSEDLIRQYISEYRNASTDQGRRAALSKIMSERQHIAENNRTARELPLADYQQALTELQNEAEDIQTSIEDATRVATEADYQSLIKNSEAQVENLTSQRDLYQSWLDGGLATEGSDNWNTWTNAVRDYNEQIQSAEQSQREWNDAIAQLPIDESAQKVSELQTQAEVLQDAISYRESRGLKKSVKDYDKLLDNSKEQVKEIRNQNKLLKEQQRGLEKNSSKWNDIKSQIDSNNASLRQMVETQREWQLEAGTLATQNILDTIDKIKSAMSEGHLGAETLTSLLGESPVFAQALQHTTTGQYVDTAKMQEIINQQGDYAMQLAETQQAAEALTFTQNEQQLDALSQRTGIAKDDIEALNKAIEEHPNNPDYQKMFDLTEENANIKETILNLQALQEELKYQQSALGKYQLAQSTANASDNMQTIRGGLEGAKELYDQGWIGKDDFTTFADLIATDAEIAAGTAVENFEKNYERVQRYLTENSDGVENWIDDMLAVSEREGKPWAEQIGDQLKINVDDMEAFAKAMGTSKEFAEDMLMAMKDAGYEMDLSIIGDQYANDFQTIDYMAANAGQQVKNLITEMGQLADSGIDVSGGAEAAAEAIQKLADNGVDVTDLVTQFNELGKLNGWKLEFGEDGELVFSSEFMSAAQKEAAREAQSALDAQSIDIVAKYNVDEAEVTNANNALQRYFQGNKANMEQAIKDSGILEYSLDELMNIDHHNGEWEAGEAELEAFASKIGLTVDQCDALLAVFAQLGLIDIEPEVNTTEVENATEQVEELDKTVEKPHTVKIGMETDAGTGNKNAVYDWINQQNLENAKIKIQTEIDQGSITPQEILNMNDEQITAHFNIEGDGKEEIQAIRDAAAEINAQDGADFTIKINEEQLNSLIDAVNKQQETPVEVDMDTTAWDAFKEEVEGGLTAKVTTDTPTAPTNPFPNVQTGRSSITVDGQMAVKQVNAFNDMISNIGSGKSSIELDTSEALSKITVLQSLIDGIDNKEVTVTLADGGIDEQIATINGYITELTSVPASVSINLDGQMFMQQLSALNTMIEEVPDANPTVNANTATAVARINNVSSILGKLNGKAANVYVNVIDRVSSVLRNIQSQLNTLNGKTSTITIVTERKTKYTTEGRGQQALGTAHSTGTAYSMWTDYRHGKNAYAAGSAQDWRLGEDQEALVNELAPQHPESIVNLLRLCMETYIENFI